MKFLLQVENYALQESLSQICFFLIRAHQWIITILRLYFCISVVQKCVEKYAVLLKVCMMTLCALSYISMIHAVMLDYH